MERSCIPVGRVRTLTVPAPGAGRWGTGGFEGNLTAKEAAAEDAAFLGSVGFGVVGVLAVGGVAALGALLAAYLC